MYAQGALKMKSVRKFFCKAQPDQLRFVGCPTGIEMLTRMAAVKLAFEDNENMHRGEDRGGK